MKRLTLLTTLTVSLMFSPVCWGEWVKVSENAIGSIIYVDFDRIRQHEGYVYYWRMNDFLTPTPFGTMSGKTYIQGDCEMFRYKFLRWIFYKESMGKGTSISDNIPDTNWKYPPPDSASELLLKEVCDFVKTR